MLKPKLGKDGRYEIRFSIRGVRHFRILGEKGQSYQDAKKEAEKFFNSFAVTTTADPRPGLRAVFNKYIEVKEGRISDRSVFNAKSYLEKKFIPFFGDKPVEDINFPVELERYQKDRMKEGAKNATINRELSVIIAAVRRAYKKRELTTNPFLHGTVDKLKANKKKDYFEKDEWEKFITECSIRYKKYVDIFQTLLLTGSRLSEVLNLRWSAVNLKTGMLHIHQSKTEEDKYQVMQPELSGLLQRVKDQSQDKTGYVFTRVDEKPFLPRHIERVFDRVLLKADIRKPLTPHSIRHTAGSWLAKAGVPLQMVQAVLGHRSISSTERYSHLCPDDLPPALGVLAGRPFFVANDTGNATLLKVVK